MKNRIMNRLKTLKNNSKSGFTLIEVMVAVAIVSILAGIMVPNFNEMINKMNVEKYRASMISIHTAADLAHQPTEELNEDKVRRHSKILNTKIGEEPVEMFYTVSRDEESGIIYVRYQDVRGRVHKYDSTMSDDWNEDIGGDIGEGDNGEPGGEVVPNKNLFTANNGLITGLSQEGLDNKGTVLSIPAEVDGQEIVGIADNAFSTKTLTPTTLIPYVKSVILPEGIITIGKNSFSDGNFDKVSLPSTLKGIDNNAFNEGALDEVVLPEGIDFVGYNAFNENNIKEVSIPATLNNIGEGSFRNNKLTELTISNGVNTVGKEAFKGNIGLNEVVIPPSVTKLGSEAFKGTSIKMITFQGSQTDFLLDTFPGIGSMPAKLESGTWVLSPYGDWANQ